jgi:hypothetical protein
MTPEKANKILDRDSLIKSRKRNRIFGNIDNNEKELSITEIVDLSFTATNFFEKIKTAFERDNKFYSNIKKNNE